MFAVFIKHHNHVIHNKPSAVLDGLFKPDELVVRKVDLFPQADELHGDYQ